MDNREERTRVNRRAFVKGGSAALGATVFGMPWWALAQGVPNEFDGSKFQLKAPEPNPKSGGVLKYAITSRPPHFDFHQSGTINSLGCQGCMFDNLVRRDPRDSGKTIIPDLAHSWEIAKDGKTYTFHLREGVQFSDGAEFTSEDVKATFDRIAKPPQGVMIPRSTLFTTVSEIQAPDKKTVIFKLSEPRPASFMMAGTKRPLITNASRSTANANPTANSMMKLIQLLTNERKTMLMSTAAAVMIRPVCCMPPSMADRVSRPSSRYSFIREMRNTS